MNILDTVNKMNALANKILEENPTAWVKQKAILVQEIADLGDDLTGLEDIVDYTDIDTLTQIRDTLRAKVFDLEERRDLYAEQKANPAHYG